MVYGTIVAYNTPAPGVAGSHFGTSTANVPGLNHTVYIAVTALVLNLVVAVAATAVFRLMRLPAGADETQPAHYLAGDDGVAVEPVPVTTAPAGTG
jgi:SSS family solute:Na+ symporter